MESYFKRLLMPNCLYFMGQAMVLGQSVAVEAIEDGLLIRFTPTDGCGQYFLRSYFSATDQTHLVNVAAHLRASPIT